VLAEKGLEWESHDVDLMAGKQHDPEYVKLNPNHVVQTLLHDGRALIESTLINEYLDETFPQPPLRPADPAGRHAMRLWTKQIDEKVHPAAPSITYAIGTRPMLLAQPAEEREARLAQIPDPVRRAAMRSVIEHGVKAPEFAGALRAFVTLLDDMEQALARDAWLAGPEPSLADAAALPYVLRLEHLALHPLLSPDARPGVAAWLARVKARPAFEMGVAAFAPGAVVAMLRANGEAVWADVEALTTS
jgi:glutathione S-transferase